MASHFVLQARQVLVGRLGVWSFGGLVVWAFGGWGVVAIASQQTGRCQRWSVGLHTKVSIFSKQSSLDDSLWTVSHCG